LQEKEQEAVTKTAKALTEAELDAALVEMDRDGSGEVDFNEFWQWWEENQLSESTGFFGRLFGKK
jgi:Ca2+-binding EF-hand superfamily protein